MPQKYFIFLRRSAEKVLYKMPNQISQRIEKIIDAGNKPLSWFKNAGRLFSFKKNQSFRLQNNLPDF